MTVSKRSAVRLQNQIEEESLSRSKKNIDATVQATVAKKVIIKAMLRPSTIR